MRTVHELLSKCSIVACCTLLAGCVPSTPEAKLFESAAADLPHQIALAKAAGLPFSSDDLHVPPVKDSENAAPSYNEMEALTKKKFRNEWWDLFAISSKTPDYKAKVKAAFQNAEPLLALARKATDLPHCHFSGPNGLFGHYFLKSVARAFYYKATLLASDGDYANAADCLLRASKVGDQYAEMPNLIGALTDVAIKASVCRVIETAYTTQKGNPACVQTFGKALDQMQETLPFADGFAEEFLESVKGLGPFSKNDKEAAGVIKVLSSQDDDLHVVDVKPSVALAAFEARLIEVDREVYDLGKQNANNPRELAVQLSKLSSQVRSQDRTYAMVKGMSFFAGVVVSFLTVKAELDLLKAATEVLTVRNKTGQFPNAFSSTVPDPFTGKPFLYTKTPSGFTLSSVGPKAIPGADFALQKARSFTYPTKLAGS